MKIGVIGMGNIGKGIINSTTLSNIIVDDIKETIVLKEKSINNNLYSESAFVLHNHRNNSITEPFIPKDYVFFNNSKHTKTCIKKRKQRKRKRKNTHR